MRTTKLAVEWVPISRVHLNPSNPRQNDQGVPQLADSIRRFNWQQPLVVRRDGQVIAGNTRLKAALHLGLTEVPVVWFDGSDVEALAYSIADNKLHEMSSWIEADLAKILTQLREEDALVGVGFDDASIDELLRKLDAELPAAPLEDPGPGEPPVNPVSCPGDLWVLGDHQLLCGDSTKAENYARLLGDERVPLLATDPPYAVNYTGNDRPIHDGKPSGKDWSALYHETDIKDLGAFLDSVLSPAVPYLGPGAAVYMWHAHVQQPTIAALFERHGLLLHQILIWEKPTATFGHSYYRWRHEPCAFGWRQGSKPQHGVGQLDTIWTADWDGKARITTFHPTSKPTRLFEIPMEQHTAVGDVVLEPFSGSGSQLIAAERLRRRCRAIEIQPAFVDGSILRWEKATGKHALLDGRTYAAIAAERGVEP